MSGRYEVHVTGPGDHQSRFEIERDEAPREGQTDHADPLSSMSMYFKLLRVEGSLIYGEWHPRPGPASW